MFKKLKNFKFHYVSINSRSAVWETCRESTLNSIMFLLILLELNQKKTLILPLNSIMFLLIPAVTKNDGYDNGFFKFHYVSINSHPRTTWTFWNLWIFKFHYVSINSYWNHLHQFDPLMSLNSIMFLLILVAVWYGIVTINTLNSIMFLLILLFTWRVIALISHL